MAPARTRSIWLGISVAWLVQLGLKAILPSIVLVVIRFWSLTSDHPSPWLEDPDDANHPVWYALQAFVFVGSVFAGSLASMWARRRSPTVPIALAMLSLAGTMFEQFPRHISIGSGLIWTGGPCVGLVLGVLLGWRLARGEAESNAENG